MSEWSSAKGSEVLNAPFGIGWTLKRQRGSHRVLSRPDWPDITFAFGDAEEFGPRMFARIAKATGLKPDDL